MVQVSLTPHMSGDTMLQMSMARFQAFETLTVLLAPSIQRIVEFAKRVPGTIVA